MTDNPWIKCSEELPPCDGVYEVLTSFVGLKCKYDGVNFLVSSQDGVKIVYCEYWRHIKPKEKRYGKVK